MTLSVDSLEARSDEPLNLAGPENTIRAVGSTTSTGEVDSVRTPAPSISVTPVQARNSVQWLADMVMEDLPSTYDGDKGWGDTKKVWAGVKFRRDGFKLKTHRRFREVEHGRWLKYGIAIPGGAADVTVHNVDPIVDQTTGDARWRIQSSVVAPMNFTARIQRWNLGVRLFSMTLTGQMRVRLLSESSVAFVADYGEIPPALVMTPRVENAQLVLESFHVDRISRVGGEVAEQWGDLVEETLVDRFVDKQNERLVDKLNQAIDKRRDDMRLSMAEWFDGWNGVEDHD